MVVWSRVLLFYSAALLVVYPLLGAFLCLMVLFLVRSERWLQWGRRRL